MTAYPSFPMLLDSTKQLSTTKLKEWKYLTPNQDKSGVVSWSTNGDVHSRISIAVKMFEDSGIVFLSYTLQGKPIEQRIELVKVASNLGKGHYFLFQCPYTHKLCRKLYFNGGYFMHRSNCEGAMYDCQTQSKAYRALDNSFGVFFRTDDLYEQLYSKNFKKTYAGKPKRRYLSIMKKLEKVEQICYDNLHQMLLS